MGYYSGSAHHTTTCPSCGRTQSHLGNGPSGSETCYDCRSRDKERSGQISVVKDAILQACKELGLTLEEAKKILNK